MTLLYRLVIASCVLAIASASVWTSSAVGQGKDYGDAPEGALAYPSLGINGQFPTCIQVGPASFVEHGLGWAHFFTNNPPQLGWDPDGDGNGGTCPLFAPYDVDECYFDGDAGLVFPDAYTIVGGSVVLCPNSTGVPLGPSCTVAQIQANIVNNMPVPGFVNLVVDYNQNGQWAGNWPCPTANAPEHAVVNDPIPVGFNGLWLSPPFLIGSPGNCFVWMRLEIAEQQVPVGWDGSGIFEDGESEDYLVFIDPPPVAVEVETWGFIKNVYR